jgi:hypothetical protein
MLVETQEHGSVSKVVPTTVLPEKTRPRTVYTAEASIVTKLVGDRIQLPIKVPEPWRVRLPSTIQ